MTITVFLNTMARYRRRYTRPIIRTARKRWNVTADQYHSNAQNYNNNFAIAGTIAYNSDDNAQPTPAILKCKNATMYGSFSIVNMSTAPTEANPLFVMAYIIYIPQIVYTTLNNVEGATNQFNFVGNLVDQHPEWVMSTRNVNLQYNGTANERATVRWTQTTGILKRNLKSGDRIMFFLTARFIGSGTVSAEFYGESKCNTCAN